jgi:hypothetical protein
MRQCATMRAHAAGCGLGWLGFSEPMLGRSAFEGGRRERHVRLAPPDYYWTIIRRSVGRNGACGNDKKSAPVTWDPRPGRATNTRHNWLPPSTSTTRVSSAPSHAPTRDGSRPAVFHVAPRDLAAASEDARVRLSSRPGLALSARVERLCPPRFWRRPLSFYSYSC